MPSEETPLVVTNENPEVAASIFSKLYFCWVNPIFRLGSKRSLQPDDMYPIDPEMASETLTARLEKEWQRQVDEGGTPSLIKAIFVSNKSSIIFLLLLAHLFCVIRIANAFLFARIAVFFDPYSSVGRHEVLILTAGCAGVSVLWITVLPFMFYRTKKFASTLKIAVTGMIYRKACKLNQTEFAKLSVGNVVNLIENDAQRLEANCEILNGLVVQFLFIPLTFLLMCHQLGVIPSLVGYGSFLLIIPLQYGLGKQVAIVRAKTAPLSDERVKKIHEILTSMKLIKMYGWELMFKKLVETVRSREIWWNGIYVLLTTMTLVISMIWAPGISLLITVLYMKSTGTVVTTSWILSYLAFAFLIRIGLHFLSGQSFIYLGQLEASIKRIEICLLYKDDLATSINAKDRLKGVIIRSKVQQGNDGLTMIKMDNLNVTWGERNFGLSDLSISIRRRELVAIVGPVGCGKTTFLLAILRELRVLSGELYVQSSVSYASQTPWIFNGTVEDNIVFKRTLDQERLLSCINDCCLEDDLLQFPEGLRTRVGDKGMRLSGGQKARISLARAVYGNEDIILLDDPLSAVDSRSSEKLFRGLIKGSLATKTRLIVTHSTCYLPEVDRIIVLEPV